MGYCALDRRREMLSGTETRSCWQGPTVPDPEPGLFELLPEPAKTQPGFADRATFPEAFAPPPLGSDRPVSAVARSGRDGQLVEAPVVMPGGRVTAPAPATRFEPPATGGPTAL
jgi:hypothetical protein